MMASKPDKRSLKILLIGKTGHGKSATGNSILGRKAFKSSSKGASLTKTTSDAWAEHGMNEIQVIDGPGLEDTDLGTVQNEEQACKNMAQALMMSNGGVHAFVLVSKFGCRFTEEERRTISDLKQIFGDGYLKERGIIVITGGDQFHACMETDETPGKTFTEWCGEQDTDLGNLIQECSPRIVMFNNVSKCEEEKRAQRNELLRHAEELRQKKGLYTNENFQKYEQMRKKMIKDSNQKILEETIQKKIDFLSAELGQRSIDSSLADIDRLDARIKDVYTEIGKESQQQESMKPLIANLERLGRASKEFRTAIQDKNMRDKQLHLSTLSRGNQELNEARLAPYGCFFAGIGIGLGISASIIVGAVAGAVDAAIGIASTPIAMEFIRSALHGDQMRDLTPMAEFLFRFAMNGYRI